MTQTTGKKEYDINTAEGARQYLISEGIDPDEIVKKGLAFIEKLKAYLNWKNELIEITAKETGLLKDEIKINYEEAKSWFESGVPPYFCFRETWQSDGD